MPTAEVHHTVAPAVRASVERLLAAASQATSRPALSDHLAADLAGGGGEGFVAVTLRDAPAGELVGYAQLSAGNDAVALETVLHPDRAGDVGTLGHQLVRTALDALGGQGGGRVNWLVVHPTEAHAAVAAELGMASSRRLFQMRRPLPTGMEVTVTTRGFVVGRDEDGWLEINNAAFADHAEQGGWTLDTIRRRQAEAWFDADDVRILDRDGRMAAFCWTKVHPATGDEPELGEIYVIAVHPDFHGQGLGRQMTLAGLDHLAAKGITHGMLWVDADNAVAVRLYERLGFTVHETTVAYSTTVAAR